MKCLNTSGDVEPTTRIKSETAQMTEALSCDICDSVILPLLLFPSAQSNTLELVGCQNTK